MKYLPLDLLNNTLQFTTPSKKNEQINHDPTYFFYLLMFPRKITYVYKKIYFNEITIYIKRNIHSLSMHYNRLFLIYIVVIFA